MAAAVYISSEMRGTGLVSGRPGEYEGRKYEEEKIIRQIYTQAQRKKR